MVGHLRSVKDPLLAAHAAALLPASSRVRVVHLGACLEPGYESIVRAEMERNPRYRWLGPLSRRSTLLHIARAHALALTSRSEGGANVIAEAVMAGAPVLATRIDGVVGQLGPDHPGYFAVGDVHGLAALMERAERDSDFYAQLQRASERRRADFEPAREREGWRAVLGALTAG